MPEECSLFRNRLRMEALHCSGEELGGVWKQLCFQFSQEDPTQIVDCKILRSSYQQKRYLIEDSPLR